MAFRNMACRPPCIVNRILVSDESRNTAQPSKLWNFALQAWPAFAYSFLLLFAVFFDQIHCKRTFECGLTGRAEMVSGDLIWGWVIQNAANTGDREGAIFGSYVAELGLHVDELYYYILYTYIHTCTVLYMYRDEGRQSLSCTGSQNSTVSINAYCTCSVCITCILHSTYLYVHVL